MSLKVGDVVNFNWNKGLFMRAVTLYNKLHYGKSEATHSGIVSRVEGEKVYIMEAVRTFKEEEYDLWWLDLRIKDGTITIRRANANLTNISENIKKYEGLKYDWLSIILLPFKLFISSSKLLFCSEAIGRILYDSGVDVASELGIDYEKLTPMDLQISKQLKTISLNT